MATITAGGPLLKNNDQVLIDTGDCTAFSATVTGTFVGTITFQVLYDTTEGWVSAPCFTRAGVGASAVLTAPGNRFINSAGSVAVRAWLTPYTSGSAECTFCGVPSISVAAASGGGGGASTIADGGDVAEGTTADPGIITDTSGTVIGFLRGAIKMWITFLSRLPAALVGGRLDVNLGATGVTQPVSGTVTANAGSGTMTVAGAVTNTNLDVALSTRTKPADQQHAIVDSSALPTGAATEATLALIKTDVDKIPPLTGPYPCTGFAPAAPTCTFTRPANTTAYTIGDEVGTAGTAPTTISVARANGLGGIIQGAQAVYSNYPAVVPSLVLFVFSATVTLAGDNNQFALSDADAAKIVAVIPLSSTQALNYSAGAAVSSGALFLAGAPSRPAPHFVCGGSEVTLYCCLVTLNAFTPIASSETIACVLDVEQN